MNLHTTNRRFTHCLVAASVVLIAGAPAFADISDIVLVRGWSTDFETDYVDTTSGPAIVDDADRDAMRAEACDALTEDMNFYASSEGPSIVGDIVVSLPQEIRQDFMDDVVEAREKLCEEPDLFSGFNIVYTSCSMYMDSEGMQMLLTVPPGAADAIMQVMSPEGGMRANLTRVAADTGPSNILEGPKPIITPKSGRQDFFGHEAREYDYKYVARGNMTPGMPLNMGEITMTSTGTAWLADGVPGHDVIVSFYDTFASEVKTGGTEERMLGGLVRQMAALIKNGFPMLVDSTTEVTMRGSANMMAGSHSNSVSRVTGVAVLPLSMASAPVSNLCNHSIIPEGMDVVDLNQMMSEADSGMNPEQAAEMEQAMQDMNEAYANMTPEQKAMMESMGMQVPAAAQAGAAGSAVAATSGPSMSSALTTDNMTETVQNHLEFLGYDAGNTDGELSTMTIVAISQFQSEMGIEVTGEVTPQLLGMLAAEVDGR